MFSLTAVCTDLKKALHYLLAMNFWMVYTLLFLGMTVIFSTRSHCLVREGSHLLNVPNALLCTLSHWSQICSP